jgi:hypothetical protein
MTCPVCHSDKHGCFESVALNPDGSVMWVCVAPKDFGEALADLVKGLERYRTQPEGGKK